MAGQALMVSEVRIASNRHSVNTAAPLANQPKTLSAKGPERAFFSGGGVDIARAFSFSFRVAGESPCARVDDIGTPCCYLVAMALPDASLISPQDF